jgi:predicted RNase H-like nuclease
VALLRALCGAHPRRGREGSGLRAALGIDAAWTTTEPSGVAYACEIDGRWRLLAAESSYERFRARSAGLEPPPPRGEPPDVAGLLDACRRLGGGAPDLVAVDMPLALTPIIGRRASDLEISRRFGAAKAATHSPSALRPGALADGLREDFGREGFPLCTKGRLHTPGLMEVYPHTALLALTGDKVRLTYKAGKTTTYWPGEPLAERGRRLREAWARIVALLEREIAGVAEALAPPSAEIRGRALKAYEDRLDAVVCVYVAIAALRGEAAAFGDDVSAIWVPARPNLRKGI